LYSSPLILSRNLLYICFPSMLEASSHHNWYHLDLGKWEGDLLKTMVAAGPPFYEEDTSSCKIYRLSSNDSVVCVFLKSERQGHLFGEQSWLRFTL
jgi:hypothetical protein